MNARARSTVVATKRALAKEKSCEYECTNIKNLNIKVRGVSRRTAKVMISGSNTLDRHASLFECRKMLAATVKVCVCWISGRVLARRETGVWRVENLVCKTIGSPVVEDTWGVNVFEYLHKNLIWQLETLIESPKSVSDPLLGGVPLLITYVRIVAMTGNRLQ